MAKSSFLDQLASEMELFRGESLKSGKKFKSYPADMRRKAVSGYQKAARELGMSRRDFAKRVGLSETAVRQWVESSGSFKRERRVAGRARKGRSEEKFLPVSFLGETFPAKEKPPQPAAAIIVVWEVTSLGRIFAELSGGGVAP